MPLHTVGSFLISSVESGRVFITGLAAWQTIMFLSSARTIPSFCAIIVLEIPFEVHNGHYQLQIIPSANPVCISDESDPTEVALSLKIGLKDFNGSVADSLAILSKLYQYNWHIKFTDKDGKVTTEFDNETVEPIWNLMNSALRDYTSQTMTVAISSSLSDICETIDQASEVSSLNISIREGGISLALASSGKVCLLDTDTLMLTASVSPQKSLVNILDNNGIVIGAAFDKDNK